MLKRAAWVLWLVLCFCVHIGPVARADAASQAEQQIQAVYDSQDAAMGRRDLKASISHIDPAYVLRGADGSAQAYKAYVADMAVWFAHKMSADYVTTVEKVRMVGPKTAFVLATHNINFGIFDPKSGVAGDAASTYTVHDKWIKQAKGWVLIQSFVVGKAHKK